MKKSTIIHLAVVLIAIAAAFFTTRTHAVEIPVESVRVAMIKGFYDTEIPAPIEIVEEEIVQAPVQPVLALTEKEKECLAHNIYFEARGEGFMGMLAVAYVTINRTLHEAYPDDVCAVVKQKHKSTCQFSWVCQLSNAKVRDSESFEKAKTIVTMLVYDYSEETDPTKGALNFHTRQVSPAWKHQLKKTTAIKNHIFYRPKSK